ncbi:MAG: dienelactone hydrolase family protein [Bryobacterales bacterium]|nr:dienelactone hydrolase family protein [Acidobacteriota bacterium]MCB9384482.1 dienelactone hydrolase family protein [Bryobacterales bacterium]
MSPLFPSRPSRLAVLLCLAALLGACGRRVVREPPPPPPPPAPRQTKPAPTPAPKPEPKAKPAPKPTPTPKPPPKKKPSPLAKAPPPIPEQPPWKEGHFTSAVYRNEAGVELTYQLYMPATCERPCPLVLYLHSASGRGEDNETNINGSRRWGAAFWTSDEVQQRHPSFVLIPQANPRLAPTWVRLWRKDPGEGAERAEPLELAIDLIGELRQKLPIDPKRTYVTGFSMGGFGSWIAISRHPDLFAAAAPIAGGGDPAHVSGARSAVWAFHGTKDSIVPVSRSRAMVEALRGAGAHPRYTEYGDKGHFIIREALGEPELVDWLFSQEADWLP